MKSVQFTAEVKNGVIEIPAEFKEFEADSAHVILVSVQERAELTGFEYFMDHPIRAKDFKPLTRDEAHARD